MPASGISQMQALGDDTYQQKRKRRISTVAAKPIRNTQRLHDKAEHNNAKRPKLLLSPFTTQTSPPASRNGRKRKAALLERVAVLSATASVTGQKDPQLD
ncbi:MAG: hypothetical protein M1816_001451 [Peltula sp. TS41687]|nr:MAG: hypothetical protein M1816_001451 [Peltula sp. TS41687]